VSESVITEQELKEKLRKIEALFAGASTPGERVAAKAARDRIQSKLQDLECREKAVEMRFTLGDGWHLKLFTALCRRYGLKPYRRQSQRRTTVLLMVVPSFVNDILWPEFTQLAEALREYLDQATDRIIREEVFKDSGDPAHG
jgi:hypothetical protein